MKVSKSKYGRLRTPKTGVTTIRLDPETRFLAEIAARIESRTFNSFVEWAAKVALTHVKVPGFDKTTVSDLAGDVWSPDETTCFVNLIFKYPRLLDETGQRIHVLIKGNGYFWRDATETSFSNHRPELLLMDRLRENWEKLKAVAEGNADPSVLPKLEPTKKKEK